MADPWMMWGELPVVLVCAWYLATIMVSSRSLIAAPKRRWLQAQIDDSLSEVRFHQANSPKLAESLTASLNELRPPDAKGVKQRLAWVFDTPLTKLETDIDRYNRFRRKIVELVPEPALKAYAEPALARLRTQDAKAEGHLRSQLDESDPVAKRGAISSANELLDAQTSANLHLQLRELRITFWLALVGLAGALIIGWSSIGHEQTMLVGALGGFIAPLVRVQVATGEADSSMGTMVLSPVGGALTAVGGLLLVSFLADDGVGLLGETFSGVWTKPETPIALALALLFGFSGRLFSSLAISATAHISKPDMAGNA